MECAMYFLFGLNFPVTIVFTFLVAFSALTIAYFRTNDFKNNEGKIRESENNFLSRVSEKIYSRNQVLRIIVIT